MQYGQSLYGILSYGNALADDTKDIDTSSLMRYLPQYWQDITEMVALQKALEPDVDAVHASITDLLNQCFILTATWGLALWERELALMTNPAMSYERRREIILAKLRGTGTTTIAMIKRVAIAFSGGEVEVIEHNEEYWFELYFVGTLGIPANMDGLIGTIDEIKPAHLGYSTRYRFTTWGMLFQGALTWDAAKTETWDQLRVHEERKG